jgi:hypothetical protein
MIASTGEVESCCIPGADTPVGRTSAAAASASHAQAGRSDSGDPRPGTLDVYFFVL